MLYLLEEQTVFALLTWNVLDETLVALEIFLWFQELNVIFSSAFLAKVQTSCLKFDTPISIKYHAIFVLHMASSWCYT